MAAEAATKLATYEDLLVLPEEVRAEVIGGRLVTAPPPLPRHSFVVTALAGDIGLPFGRGGRGPGGWWILSEVDVRLGPHDILRPDVAGWRRERPRDPWEQRPIEVPPDWVAEVLSPTTAARDRGEKMLLYGEHGVGHAWLLDPSARTLEAYGREAGSAPPGWRWVLLGAHGPGERVHLPPFEAVELAVADLFPPPPEAAD